MGEKILGDDGLIASEVGVQAKEKHEYLRRYLDISSGARKRYIGPNNAGATFVDLFCGAGRSKIKDTGEWIDGSAVAAWKISKESSSPFTEIYVGDLDEENLDASVRRLKDLDALVKALHGPAVETVQEYVKAVSHYGLHVAFVDPFSLGALNFRIIETLATLKRPDMLLHVSKMDLQRNLNKELEADNSMFDTFVPNWRPLVDIERPQQAIRQQMMELWQEKITALGLEVSNDTKLVKGNQNQHLYWLYLVAKHDLAKKFWKIAGDTGQGSLFDF
ncbi:MAG: three-Cys-motif partner protein TcmP [Methylocystaceae bacterium]|nr:three-Cys-motif partner protein TcmP [Methylocystaceae bacterium]